MDGCITFLGTGTSQGVPMIGCNCHVCKSADSKDNRLRSSALIDYKGFRILIDCGPDFRQQMLREGVQDVDALLLTHQHKDHTGGMDDIRAFNYFREAAFPIYAETRVQESVKREYAYAFYEIKYPGVPDFNLITIDEEPFTITKTSENGEKIELEITPIRIMHYKLPILGFRIGNLAYITDGSYIPENQFRKLENLDILVINAIRHEPHLSHFSLPQALEMIDRIGARRNYLTHLSHQIGTHEELSRELPGNVLAAYDTLKVCF